jgi:hypothetical protein
MAMCADCVTLVDGVRLARVQLGRKMDYYPTGLHDAEWEAYEVALQALDAHRRQVHPRPPRQSSRRPHRRRNTVARRTPVLT